MDWQNERLQTRLALPAESLEEVYALEHKFIERLGAGRATRYRGAPQR